jgi:ketosteroid isomerase-like protein
MMRRMLLLPLLAIALVAIARAQETATSEAEKEVLKADEARNEVLQKGDADGVARYLTDDVQYGNERGEILSKDQMLANLRSRKQKFLSFKHDDIHVTVHGDTGVVTGRSTSVVEFQGKISSHPRRFMNVWVKQGDGPWLLAAHSETAIAGQ